MTSPQSVPRPRVLILLGVAVVALAGCTVAPVPLTPADHQSRVAADQVRLFVDQEPVTGPISLYEAMARALKYNLDRRQKMMEEALAQRQLDLARFDLLPDLVASAGYAGRSNDSGASSRSLITGRESLEPSTSQEQHRRTYDLGLTWNILDFGVSYVSAKQQADRALIALERRRKVIHNIVQDVRHAYWRAVAAERLLQRLAPLTERLQQAREKARTIEEQRLEAPLEALAYQKNLLAALHQAQSLRQELALAKTELAALMNLPPSTDFELVVPEAGTMTPPRLELEVARLEEAALHNRPELHEEAYRTRIGAQEARKALLGLLPGISLSAGRQYDSNDYLYNNRWTEYGLQVHFNLLNVFSAPATMAAAEARQTVDEARRLALSMAVLTQVHVSLQRYAEAVALLDTTSEMARIEGRISGHLSDAGRTRRQGELEVVYGELNAVIADLRRDLAWVEAQNALGRIGVSVGLDPLPERVESDSVAGLARALEQALGRHPLEAL